MFQEMKKHRKTLRLTSQIIFLLQHVNHALVVQRQGVQVNNDNLVQLYEYVLGRSSFIVVGKLNNEVHIFFNTYKTYYHNFSDVVSMQFRAYVVVHV